MRTVLQIIISAFLVSTLSASVPPQIDEVSSKDAQSLGFKVEKKIVGTNVEFDVVYPDQIEEWDIPQAPRILVTDLKNRVVLETYAVLAVSRDRKDRALRFGFTYDSNHEVILTFWYQSKIHGDASKGYQINASEFPKNDE